MLVLATALAPRAAELICDMDTLRHRAGEFTNKDKQKAPVGTAEVVEGTSGKAVQFRFSEGAQGFFAAPVQGAPEWNRAAGFSFYVKGDGSTNWGGLELIDRNNFRQRYGFCFPIDSRAWRKVTVAWRDLVPELDGPPVDAAGGYAPAGFGNLWFGKWHYWREYPAHSYAIDQVALEDEVPATGAPRGEAGVRRLRAKLERREPVTLVTMGDSLSDKRHWANRDLLWSEELVRQLRTKHGGEVALVNPAIGGTTLSQNLVLMPRWLCRAPQPDLVTVWFGYNDWDAGVRGARFKEYLRLAVERIRRMTGGHADVLLVTSCPAFARWEDMKELEDAARDVATETGVALADVAAAFRRAGSPEEAMRLGHWAGDKTHLGPEGHALAAATVLKAIED